LAFRAHLFENEQLFQAEELRDLYLLAINYCIRRLNQGEMQYAKEGLDWYKRGLASGGLLTDGVLSRFTYRNIVAMGLKVGDFEWVQSFIYEYKSLLEKQHRESMFTFNLAKLAYHRKQYQEALNLLRKAKYKDLLLNLAAKTLLLKTYYELEEWDMLESHLEAMQNYLRRKKVMGYHQTNYKNLIHYTKKLVSVSPYNKTAKEDLEKRLDNEEILTEKEWLLEQLRLL
jgi:tetratricopeptide (TPR) repeat protein